MTSLHLISRSATTPGRYRWGFLTPPVAGADLRATRVASCLRGALPPVERRAVCLVRAIVTERNEPGLHAAKCERPERFEESESETIPSLTSDLCLDLG
jgi:hypothetical protein